MNDFSCLQVRADIAAKRLLGSIIERQVDGQILRAKIVETEAYDETDAASHSYNGRTPRVEVMYGQAGYAYVYFTYGMHYCFNVVVGQENEGAGVLIRAVEPLDGMEYMRQIRQTNNDILLTNGPAKLCQALSIDKKMYGHDLKKLPLRLLIEPAIDNELSVVTTRIGVSKAKDVAWRFYIKGNAFVSKR